MESAHSAQPLTVGNLPEKLPQPGQVHFSIIVRGWGGGLLSLNHQKTGMRSREMAQ